MGASFWIPPLCLFGYRGFVGQTRALSLGCGGSSEISNINKFIKFEIRNSKQFQMTKNQNVSNEAGLNFENWDLILLFVSDFELRISDFYSGASWRDRL